MIPLLILVLVGFALNAWAFLFLLRRIEILNGSLIRTLEIVKSLVKTDRKKR